MVAQLARLYQERLRAVGALDFDDLLIEAVRLFERGAGRAAPLPGSLALPPRRRIPGHEPPAVPVGEGARGAPPEPRRRRRRRPVDLLLARRGHPQHPRLRARLPRRDRGEARAELPQHAADPRRRPRRRDEQRGAQGQEALDGERGRPADPALRGVRRRGRGRVDRPPDRRADRRQGLAADAPRR